MFSVKAEVMRSDSVPSYTIYEAVRVQVLPPQQPMTSDSPRSGSHDAEVWLYHADGRVDQIEIGTDHMQHFQAVYVMNERGKTIDVIQPKGWPSVRAA